MRKIWQRAHQMTQIKTPNVSRLIADTRLGQPDGISPSRMAEMLEVDKAGPESAVLNYGEEKVISLDYGYDPQMLRACSLATSALAPTPTSTWSRTSARRVAPSSASSPISGARKWSLRAVIST